MNKENLKAIADYIITIDQKKFDMWTYRTGSSKSSTIECNTIGCTIGHSVILDPNPKDIPRDENRNINFNLWSEKFTGLTTGSDEWDWCFASEWYWIDNSPEGVNKRIKCLLTKGIPADFLLKDNSGIRSYFHKDCDDSYFEFINS